MAIKTATGPSGVRFNQAGIAVLGKSPYPNPINCTTYKLNYDQGGADGASGAHLFSNLNGASSKITTANISVSDTTFTNTTSFNMNAPTIDNSESAVTLFPSVTTLSIDAGAIDLGSATVSGLTKPDVGLDQVDTTADADKPVSTAQQTALDAKADLTGNNTFTGDNIFNTGTLRIPSFTNNDTGSLFSCINSGANSISPGTSNNYLGANSMPLMTTGSHNNSCVTNCLSKIPTQQNNSAFGCGTGQNITSSYNSAFGCGVMSNGATEFTGHYNTGCGWRTVRYGEGTAANNAGLGAMALQNATTASNCCGIGYLAGAIGGAVDSYADIITESGKFVFGNNNYDVYYFSGASTSLIDSNSTTINLYTTPTTLNLGNSGITSNLNGTTNADVLTCNSLNGISSTVIGYLDPTSSIQTQMNTKDPLNNPDFTGGTITETALTQNLFNTRTTTLNIGGAATTSINDVVVNSLNGVMSTKIGYLDATSSIQTQLNLKLANTNSYCAGTQIASTGSSYNI